MKGNQEHLDWGEINKLSRLVLTVLIKCRADSEDSEEETGGGAQETERGKGEGGKRTNTKVQKIWKKWILDRVK